MSMDLNQLKDMLPFLIPIIVVEFGLLIYVIRHILTHEHYKRGNRVLWLVISIVLCNFVGPILYLLLGKEDA